MRKMVVLQTEKPKIDSDEVKRRIGAIVEAFDAYLDEYPVKNARSKHAVMGPVAKVLDRAEAGQWDVEPLTGFALRMHEMNPRTSGRISIAAVTRLREGTEKLLALCRDVPVTALASTVEQVDYSLYFQRRMKGLAWMEQRQTELQSFLREKYGSDEAFAKAWGKKGGRIADQYFFGEDSPTYRKGTDALHADMNEFYQRMRQTGETPEAIIDEEPEA